MIGPSTVERSGFPTRPLSEVAEFLDHRRKPITAKDREPGPIPYYGANGQQDSVADWLFDEPLVLLAEDGGQFETPDRGIAYRIDGKSWVNNHAHVLRAGSSVDTTWLTRVLENFDVTSFITGSTRAKLTKSGAARIPIPVPPLGEQRRIAQVLDAADELQAKRRQALAKLDTLTQAIFIDMFGDPIANDRGWAISELGSVCERIQIGPFGSKLHKSDYVSGGIPLVNPMHIVDGSIVPDDDQSVSPAKCGELQSYLLEVDDVVMGRRGEMGRVAIVRAREAGYVCGSGSLFARLDLQCLRPAYLAAALSSPQGRRRLEQSAQGVTMPNLNASIVQSFRLAIPPVEQQVNFEVAVEGQRRIERSTRKHMIALDDLFASLQQRAFRGDL